MQNNVIEVGDMIEIEGLGYEHVGLYVGSGWFRQGDVVHNTKGGGVVLSTLAEFAKGSPVYLHKKAGGSQAERQMIARRALSLVGQKYDLLFFNCEHAANLAQTGRAESPQLAAIAGVLLVLGLAAFVFSED